MNECKDYNAYIEEATYKSCIEFENKLGLNNHESLRIIIKSGDLLSAKGIKNNHQEIISILPDIYLFIKRLITQRK